LAPILSPFAPRVRLSEPWAMPPRQTAERFATKRQMRAGRWWSRVSLATFKCVIYLVTKTAK